MKQWVVVSTLIFFQNFCGLGGMSQNYDSAHNQLTHSLEALTWAIDQSPQRRCSLLYEATNAVRFVSFGIEWAKEIVALVLVYKIWEFGLPADASHLWKWVPFAGYALIKSGASFWRTADHYEHHHIIFQFLYEKYQTIVVCMQAAQTMLTLLAAHAIVTGDLDLLKRVCGWLYHSRTVQQLLVTAQCEITSLMTSWLPGQGFETILAPIYYLGLITDQISSMLYYLV